MSTRSLYFVSQHPPTAATFDYALRHGEVWTDAAEAMRWRAPTETLYAVTLGDVTIL